MGILWAHTGTIVLNSSLHIYICSVFCLVIMWCYNIFYMFSELTGHDIDRFIFWNFEYGEYYSGPGYVLQLHKDDHSHICMYNRQ